MKLTECLSSAPRALSSIHLAEVPPRSLHRLAVVRRQEGLSRRCVARRLGVDVATIQQQELEATDLQLSGLYRWQRALEVPVAELLIDSGTSLSSPVIERARMVKVMKTVETMLERATRPSMQGLLRMLRRELREIMPELRRVPPWTVCEREAFEPQSAGFKA